MTAISTHWRRILLICVLLWLSAPGGSGLRAQSAVESNGQGSVTIDASRLDGVISIDAPWRFHAGDDARFADPNLDDSAWPLVQPGQQLATSHISPVPDGKDWMRVHLHILNANSPLAISLLARNGMPYGVYSNGKQIGATTDFGAINPKSSQPFVIVLPQTAEIVLAIHFVTRGGLSVHYVPLEQIEIGQSQEVGERIDLERYRNFEDYALVNIAVGLLYLASVPFCLALLLAQRNHPEYFWLATLFSVSGLFFLYVSIISVRGSPGPIWTIVVYVADALDWVSLLEFVFIMGGRRRRGIVRAVQGYLLVVVPGVYILLLFDSRVAHAANIADHIRIVLVFSLVGYLLVSAYFRGSKECGFLFFPAMLIPLTEYIEYYYWNVLGPLWTGHLGGVTYNAVQVAHLLFLAGVLAVVFYRFIRVSKDEELAAAELEAARTVQQLLIPATAPVTPGFSVESIYLPAQQVGGDFFLVLPALDGSEDKSLLAIVGDVSGKGLQAAMVVSTIIGGLRMQISRRPGEVLAHLNRMLSGHVSGFVTCCAVLIEPDGRMRIANAGNPSPYLNGEEISTLPGLPLGLAAEMLYEETTGVLEQGRQLTFVSDGVIEATNAAGKELFGFERTREISGASAPAIAEAATVFGAGAPQADDITVLTVSRV